MSQQTRFALTSLALLIAATAAHAGGGEFPRPPYHRPHLPVPDEPGQGVATPAPPAATGASVPDESPHCIEACGPRYYNPKVCHPNSTEDPCPPAASGR